MSWVGFKDPQGNRKMVRYLDEGLNIFLNTIKYRGESYIHGGGEVD